MTEFRNTGPGLAPAANACAVVRTASAAELTINRLFDAPALAGPTIAALKISPDGSRVTYLTSKSDDRNRLDLWEYNIHEKAARVLVDSKDLVSAQDALSTEEISRRERQRIAAMSGILEYSYAPTGDGLMFPLSGSLYYYRPSSAGHHASVVAIDTHGLVTDPTFSPTGARVAYIRDQNLYTYDIAADSESQVTHDGAGAIKNGMAEFVAQEEMDRSTGYWWAPDGRHIAFMRVDESPIKVTDRFEISADNVATFPQRYPAAGTPNVLVRLGVSDVKTNQVKWIDLGPKQDIYIARVDWLPDGETLAIQRQSRDQHRLELLFADIKSGNCRTILTESSTKWIDLHHELSFLDNSREFVWASSRDGYQHLYLYDYDGQLIRQLTAGNWVVDAFRARATMGIDEEHRLIYFTATEKEPTERHLYSTSLDTIDAHVVHRITDQAGIHDITMSRDTRVYVDSFSNVDNPPQVTLHANDGRLLATLVENRLDANHPDSSFLADNSVPEFGTLQSIDGQTLYYRLFKPLHFDADKRYPAIVDVYGGPGAQRVLNNWSGASFTQILTRAGYVVFQLDNRGSAFRGVAFQSPIHDKLSDAEVADQVQGARWLGALPFIDSQRIGVWGWSYGGYMTLMLMFKSPGVFRAGVAGAPVTDWALYDTHYTERYLGCPQCNAVGYSNSGVLAFANGLEGKLLVIHGMADDNVLFHHSTKLFRRLQDLGKLFEVMVYPGAKHGLLRQHDGRHAYATIKQFFDSALLP